MAAPYPQAWRGVALLRPSLSRVLISNLCFVVFLALKNTPLAF